MVLSALRRPTPLSSLSSLRLSKNKERKERTFFCLCTHAICASLSITWLLDHARPHTSLSARICLSIVMPANCFVKLFCFLYFLMAFLIDTDQQHRLCLRAQPTPTLWHCFYNCCLIWFWPVPAVRCLLISLQSNLVQWTQIRFGLFSSTFPHLFSSIIRLFYLSTFFRSFRPPSSPPYLILCRSIDSVLVNSFVLSSFTSAVYQLPQLPLFRQTRQPFQLAKCIFSGITCRLSDGLLFALYSRRWSCGSAWDGTIRFSRVVALFCNQMFHLLSAWPPPPAHTLPTLVPLFIHPGISCYSGQPFPGQTLFEKCFSLVISKSFFAVFWLVKK